MSKRKRCQGFVVDLSADPPLRRCAAAAVKGTPYCQKHQAPAQIAGFAKLRECLRPDWEQIVGANDSRVRCGRAELGDTLGDLEAPDAKPAGTKPALSRGPSLAERAAELRSQRGR